MADGFLFGSCSECCEESSVICQACGDTGLPRRLEVTIEGFPDGYAWASNAGGVPPEGGGFSPNCSDDPGNALNYRTVGGAVGVVGYTSLRLVDYNQTFIATYDKLSDECSPVWYGEINLRTASRNDGNSAVEALECGTTTVGFAFSLAKENAFVDLEIRLDGSSIRGSGATGEVTKISARAIEEADVTNGGSDYAYLEVIRVEPTVTASVFSSTGSGANLSVTLNQTTDSNNEDVWEIASVTVDDAGSGYDEFGFVSFDVPGGEEQSPAFASLRLNRQEPTVSVDLPFATGSGATFSVVLNQTTDFNGEDIWEVASVSVTNGGSGYDEFDAVDFPTFDGVAVFGATAFLSVSGGVIQSVTVSSGGQYYKTDGSIAAVVVTDGGEYYEDEQTNNVIVEDVEVVVLSNTGEDAEIEAVIDDDPNSATFGEITDLVVNDGGKNYAQTEDTWVLSILGSDPGLMFLAGGSPGLGANEILCDTDNGSQDQADKILPKALRTALVSEDPCAETLLDNEYAASFTASIFPSGLFSMPGEAEYSLSGVSFCTLLRVVDWGDGPLKVTISPA